MYASSTRLCDLNFGGRPAIWAAVDMWEKAKEVDSEFTEEADKRIARYQQVYPNIDDVFCAPFRKNTICSLEGCWIGGSTTVRWK